MALGEEKPPGLQCALKAGEQPLLPPPGYPQITPPPLPAASSKEACTGEGMQCPAAGLCCGSSAVPRRSAQSSRSRSHSLAVRSRGGPGDAAGEQPCPRRLPAAAPPAALRRCCCRALGAAGLLPWGCCSGGCSVPGWCHLCLLPLGIPFSRRLLSHGASQLQAGWQLCGALGSAGGQRLCGRSFHEGRSSCATFLLGCPWLFVQQMGRSCGQPWGLQGLSFGAWLPGA